jgi:hypothetical protein
MAFTPSHVFPCPPLMGTHELPSEKLASTQLSRTSVIVPTAHVATPSTSKVAANASPTTSSSDAVAWNVSAARQPLQLYSPTQMRQQAARIATVASLHGNCAARATIWELP